MCPGTDVYMPPEAVKDEPVYTKKIDCFSFGVIIVQILTRQFPKPGNRRQEVEINHPGLPQGTVEVCIAEVDRRHSHISQVDTNHPLLPIVLDCLKDEDVERPSAQQLCERVASLKESPEYSESVTVAQQENQQLQLQQVYREEMQQIVRGKERELGQMRRQLQELQHSLTREREEKERELGQVRQLKQAHREETQRIVGEKERQLGQMRQQLERSEQERAKLEERVHDLEGLLLRLSDHRHRDTAAKVDREDNIKLMWREGRKAPFTCRRWFDAIVDGNRVYFQDGNSNIWAYDISDKSWSRLPNCPYGGYSLVILNDQLTTIGAMDPSLTKSLWKENGQKKSHPCQLNDVLLQLCALDQL